MVLPRGKQVVLTGIVIPVEWDDRQKVIAASLATSDETEYRIGTTKKGKELLAALQHEAEVSGILNQDEQGRQIITVRSYFIK